MNLICKSSRISNFILKIRPIFHRYFKKHQLSGDLPKTYDVESYFLQTIIHSLDHYMFEYYFTPQYIAKIHNKISHEKYKGMYDVMNIVCNCFIQDVPIPSSMGVEVNFKDSSLQFHQIIYQKAKQIDNEFADLLHTMIVK